MAIKESQQQPLTQLAETTTATTATHNRLQANQAQPCRDNSPLRRSRFKLKFNVARRRRLRRCLLHISSLAFDVVINILSGYSNSNCYCCSCCCRRVCQLLFRNLVICCVCTKRYTHTHTPAHTRTHSSISCVNTARVCCNIGHARLFVGSNRQPLCRSSCCDATLLLLLLLPLLTEIASEF